MDTVDLQILSKLVWRPDDSMDAVRGIVGPWDIARELALHGTTVKRRLEQMEKDGVLGGLHILPHFSLLGIQGGMFLYSYPDVPTKRRAVQWMIERRRPGGAYFLARIDSFVGTEAWAAVNVASTDDLEAAAALVGDETGAHAWRLMEREDWPLQTERVSALDRRILASFHADALRPLADVARELHTTPKTVRARLKALAKAHAFQIVPFLSPARIRGLVPHVVAVEPVAGQGPKAAASLFNAFPAAFLRSHRTALAPNVYLAAPTTHDVDRNLERAQGLPGVQNAQFFLIEESASCVPPGMAPAPVARLLEAQPEALRAEVRRRKMVPN